MLLGCIADDLTGATDLALMLTRGGMRTVQVMGVPGEGEAFAGYDAVVVALKSRTNPVAEAVAWSLATCEALLAGGARQILFKYCSTFDSTPSGNIGPVAEALMGRLGCPIAIACPAFPATGRTVYLGNLFVGSQPLAESPMKDHPLTPMRDSSLVRVLQAQTGLKVGLIPFPVVEGGVESIRRALAEAAGQGIGLVIVDAVKDEHLRAMGAAAADHRLITGGSGVAMGLPENFARAGLLELRRDEARLGPGGGRAAILAGSCSAATRGQVRVFESAGLPSRRIDPLALANGEVTGAELGAWGLAQPAGQPFLIFSSDEPDRVRAVQGRLGRDEAGGLVEAALGEAARVLVEGGVGRLIVAGGETAGAVVGALGVTAIEIGPEIDPGVPWTRSLDGRRLSLALKSGNFGAPDFFLKAWERLQ